MELNETHTEHEQATTSLKVVLLVFAVVLVGALAYLVWATNTAPDTTNDSAVGITKRPSSIDGRIEGQEYINAKYGFSITMPTGLKGFTVVPYESLETDITGDVESYFILMPLTDSVVESGRRKGEGVELFTISILLKSQYAKNSAGLWEWVDYPAEYNEMYRNRKAYVPENELMGEFATYLITYSLPQAITADELSQVTQAAKTFKPAL